MSLDVYLTAEVNTGGPCPYEVTLFQYSITHNLGPMAAEAGIYDAMWHPTNGAFNAQAKDLILRLENGITLMQLDPDRFKALNSKNGWGCYENLLIFSQRYLEACRLHPLARVRVSR